MWTRSSRAPSQSWEQVSLGPLPSNHHWISGTGLPTASQCSSTLPPAHLSCDRGDLTKPAVGERVSALVSAPERRWGAPGEGLPTGLLAQGWPVSCLPLSLWEGGSVRSGHEKGHVPSFGEVGAKQAAPGSDGCPLPRTPGTLCGHSDFRQHNCETTHGFKTKQWKWAE